MSSTTVVAFLSHLGHIGASLQPTTPWKFCFSSKAVTYPESQWVGLHIVHLQGCHSTECTLRDPMGSPVVLTCPFLLPFSPPNHFLTSHFVSNLKLVSYLPYRLSLFDLCSLFSVIPWGPVLIGPLQYLPSTSSTYVLKLRVPRLHLKSCIIFPLAFPKLIYRVPLHLTLLWPTLTSVPPDFLIPCFSLAVPSVWEATLPISAHHKPVLSSKLAKIFPGISCL